ncbi:Enoyl-CoA hydratase [Perkinsus chesapeaki]|uniref:Enoyl-CoA hydratase n=1 Tax=Perkinsus chesapeaki TaxID=330153 RepID=A0A7J6L197_PERCH|nr:Enoyl-CoA hydratase [Perkinsus chesapeaki]
MASIEITTAGSASEILLIALNRPHVRNAIDGPMADALYRALKNFDTDEDLKVAIIYGQGKDFCAGADLKSVATGRSTPDIDLSGDKSPLGFARLVLSKPVVAAISGHAVAGGLELAVWCDIRIIDPSARFGVYCRRFGVPLVDGGTINLQSVIGYSRAMDMLLTGRTVDAKEALRWGLATRAVDREEELLPEAIRLAETIAAFPQRCMRSDRLGLITARFENQERLLRLECERGLETMKSGETRDGARSFSQNRVGRHGSFGRSRI